MATEDRNGCLHGEQDGKFVSKDKTESKAYDSKDNFSELKKRVNKSDTIKVSEETIPRSVGAKWINEEILMPDGSFANFVEGSKVTREVFAGKGTNNKIRDIDRLVNTYPKTKKELWQKVKGKARLVQDGEEFDAETHWYEEPSIGRVEAKFKKEL